MRKATTYRCAACSEPMEFDGDAKTLCCVACGREYDLDMQPV